MRERFYSVESQRDLAQELLRRVDSSSLTAAYGNGEAGAALIYTLVSSGPDRGPEIPLIPEILEHLTPMQRWAVEYAQLMSGRFNRNFGWDSNVGHLLDPENHLFVDFASSLGRAVQGILNPQTELGLNLAESQIKANAAYNSLIEWASKAL